MLLIKKPLLSTDQVIPFFYVFVFGQVWVPSWKILNSRCFTFLIVVNWPCLLHVLSVKILFLP